MLYFHPVDLNDVHFINVPPFMFKFPADIQP